MRLYACFDTVTRFGRVQWILAKSFLERTEAEAFADFNKGMLMKVFEEVER